MKKTAYDLSMSGGEGGEDSNCNTANDGFRNFILFYLLLSEKINTETCPFHTIPLSSMCIL